MQTARTSHEQPVAFSFEILRSPLETVALTRNGLSGDVVGTLAAELGITKTELFSFLPASIRTIQRKTPAVLDKDLSDHVVQIARVVARSIEVFGARTKALHWLKSPGYTLDQATPLSLLDTFTGVGIVLDELTRIEHGVGL